MSTPRRAAGPFQPEPPHTPPASLRAALRRAFPQHDDLARLDLDGTVAQAWAAVCRLLGIGPDDLARALAPVFGLEPAGALDGVPPAILAEIPFSLCQTHTLLPLRNAHGRLVVATADPLDRELAGRIAFLVGRPITWVLAPPEALDDAVVTAYAAEAERIARSGEAGGAGATTPDGGEVVRLGERLLAQALERRASDLHVQPFLGAAVVRIRVDGAMQRVTMLPDAVAAMLVRHFKARAGMDPSNCQAPQDGRLSLTVGGRDVEARVSTLPAVRGERLVLRFVAQGRAYRLGGAGFSLAALQTLRRAVARPSGLIVLTGPTGSGKTATLYALLAEVNRGDVNIITVENPVEQRIPGISQIEVNDRAGRSFASVLRAILRQDPDVILLGEIRDAETAEIATQAAMTGHLVLTTLHTNDAPGAIPRLLALGVQPPVLADALVVVVAQRLCRTLCAHCKVPVSGALAPEEALFAGITRNAPAFRAAGCRECGFTGYRGRFPVVDILEMNAGLRDAVAAGECRLSVLEGLRAGGLRSLAASGSMRVISGDTTVREVMDTVGPGFWHELAAHYGAPLADDPAADPPAHAVHGYGVLLMSRDATLAAALRPAVEAEGLRLVVAADAPAARAALGADEDIAFVVGDVDDDLDLEAAAALLRDNRLHIAWARLPAIVLLPRALAGHEDALRASGVLGAFLAKPVSVDALVARIRHAQAR